MKYISLLAILLLCVCRIYSQSGYQYHSSSVNNGVQEGAAVYYADYLHGQRTALGEVYRMEAFTAAHKTLPKGTLVRVTRLDNGQSVVVRVNDRGPFDPDVIIDLSKAAAMKIGLVKKGRARVRLETVGQSDANPVNGTLGGAAAYSYANSPAPSGGAPAGRGYGQPGLSAYNYNTSHRGNVAPYPMLPPNTAGYGVQLASYRQLGNAGSQLRQLGQRGVQNLYIWQKGGYYKVLIAPFASKSSAADHLEQLRRQHLQDGIVVRIR
ncbi:MAG: septal ring lytic transglycosylase RlpA family protein [Phaeodactylibacter sp.]|nr:septal ring lytic transglycosylase RlpA family protein [Phaeodactylibacter sp.]